MEPANQLTILNIDNSHLISNIEIINSFTNNININEYQVLKLFLSFFHKIYFYFIITPLFYLYIHGPSLLNIGFWNSKSYSEICSQISNVSDQYFWDKSETNKLQCQGMIYDRFHSFLVLILTIIYFIMLYY